MILLSSIINFRNYQMDSGSFLWTGLIAINSTQELRPPRGEQLQIYVLLPLTDQIMIKSEFHVSFRFRGRFPARIVVSLNTWGWFWTCSWWNCQHAVWREHLSEHWIKVRTSLRCHGVSGSGMLSLPDTASTKRIQKDYCLRNSYQ